MKRIDFIIPYIKGPDNGLELKYALRSIEKNFDHDNYRIIIIGDKPDWLCGAEHLPFSRIPEQKHRNFADQLIKLYAALTNLDVSANFVWTYDDVYFTSKVNLADLKELKAVASFDQHPNHLDGKGAGPNWKSTLSYTMLAAIENGGSNYNYETHLPRYFNKTRVLRLIDKYMLLDKPMMISSLYYNLYDKTKTPVCLYDNSGQRIRFLLRSMFDVATLRKQLRRYRFTNNDANNWNVVLKTVLQEMFPGKSKFEL